MSPGDIAFAAMLAAGQRLQLGKQVELKVSQGWFRLLMYF